VLVDAGVGDLVKDAADGANLSPLVLAWLVAVGIRVATGSATAATITAAGIVTPLAAGLSPSEVALLVLAIGSGLRNIVTDPRVALLFLVPGTGETLRVNGTARLVRDDDLAARFAVRGKAPTLVICVTVRSVYFQCPKALVRSDLWNPRRSTSTSRPSPPRARSWPGSPPRRTSTRAATRSTSPRTTTPTPTPTPMPNGSGPCSTDQ
jgi:predicted pyridoxine 5'-phosphate oxidase superfamily flavin-nucleotide-binding protein